MTSARPPQPRDQPAVPSPICHITVGPQTRATSLFEATCNVVVGYVLAIAVQRVVYPLFGIVTTLGQDGLIALVFTVTSLGRSYALRRLFIMLDRQRGRERLARKQSLARRLSTGGTR